MSTERSVPEIASNDARPFRRRFVAVVTVLSVLVAVLVVITGAQGPKLSTAQVDTAAVVARSGQQLRMFANQSVRSVTKKQVTITPAVPFAVSTAGQVIAVQFDRPLGYATRYRVAIDGVASAADGQSSSLSYSFSTSSPRLYYLRRTVGGVDSVIETGIRDPTLTVAFSARRIQAFAAFPNALAVATLNARGESALEIIGAKGQVEQIALPAAGTIDELRADQDSGVLGFTFTQSGPTTARRYTDTLFTVDPNGTAVPVPVAGPGGRPMSILNWDFVPASSSLVAQQDDLSVVAVDTSKKNSVTPLGSFLQFGAVAADGASLTVADVNGWRRLALASGSSVPLAPSALDGAAPVAGEAAVVQGGWLQLESLFDDTAKGFVQRLVANGGKTARELFHTAAPTGRIDGFEVSPNGEFVAIETVPNVATAKPDGYLVDGRSTSATLNFVDIRTGALVKSVVGFGLEWGR